MSLMGFENLHYATLSKDDTDGITYGTPKRFAGAVSINEDLQTETAENYADNRLWETKQVFSKGEVELVMAELPTEVYAELCGHTVDSNGKVIVNASDTAPYIALLGEFKKGDGTKRYFKLLKGQCAAGGLEGETENDSPEFKNFTLNATFMARKYDGNYKYFIDSTDDNADYIATWYNSVEDSGGNTPNP